MFSGGEKATERQNLVGAPGGMAADPAHGLTAYEVDRLRRQWGFNEVAEVKPYRLAEFAGKFWGPSAWMLELVVLLSWYLGRYSDMAVVIALLVVNAALSFFEEAQAEKSLDQLKARLQVAAKVLRDGRWSAVPARELVPGDFVRLRSGDFVPADIMLVSGEVSVDQSALTGESLVVDKAGDDDLYSGSIIKRGEAEGIVRSIGSATYFGRTTQLVQVAKPRLAIENMVGGVVRRLFVIVAILAVFAVAVAYFRGLPLLEILPLLLVVLLSAVPVALPVMMTVTTALGARELAGQGVLVTRFDAVEDAAMVDVVCVDKTGTLTANKLAVSQVSPLPGYSEKDIIRYAATASRIADRDPIDDAILAAAELKGIQGLAIDRFIPFSPETRRTEAVLTTEGEPGRITKGAVETILKLCRDENNEWAHGETARLAGLGEKVLAVAAAGEGGFRLAGLVGLADRPRPDSRLLVAEAAELGIAIKMLTGDALATAIQVAAEVGIAGEMIPMSRLRETAGSDPAKAAAIIKSAGGVAEVYPEDKFLIVKYLQKAGHIVGMTGDGVNDAPALKQAEVGIAVSTATDVAKEAAGVVLTTEGLSGIIGMVRIGRSVHRRIEIWVLNKISRTILKSAFVIGGFLLTGKFFISAFAMLLLVFMTDFAKVALATDNVRWSPLPCRFDVSRLTGVAAVLGMAMVAEAGGLFFVMTGWLGGVSAATAGTLAFIILFYFAVFSLLAVREEGHFWLSRPSTVLGGVLTADLILASAISLIGLPGLAAIGVRELAMAFFGSLVFSLLANDYLKLVIYGLPAKTDGGRK